MAARSEPLGISHLTVIPANFEPAPDEESDFDPGTDEGSDDRAETGDE